MSFNRIFNDLTRGRFSGAFPHKLFLFTPGDHRRYCEKCLLRSEFFLLHGAKRVNIPELIIKIAQKRLLSGNYRKRFARCIGA